MNGNIWVIQIVGRLVQRVFLRPRALYAFLPSSLLLGVRPYAAVIASHLGQ